MSIVSYQMVCLLPEVVSFTRRGVFYQTWCLLPDVVSFTFYQTWCLLPEICHLPEV